MEINQSSCKKNKITLRFDLGTFEGFNFRHQSAIEEILTAEQMVNWDHDKDGEAEFWPSGDNDGVALIFRDHTSVTCSHVVALDTLLQDLGGDDRESFIKIYHAVQSNGIRLADLTAREVEDSNSHIFIGDCFIDLRKEAAYELFEVYWPEAFKAWESCNCDGLIFDVDRFLDSPGWSIDELRLGDSVALVVTPL